MEYICEKCDYTTHLKTRFETHLNKKIPCKKKEFKCICGSNFTLQNNLKRHQNNCQINKNYQDDKVNTLFINTFGNENKDYISEKILKELMIKYKNGKSIIELIFLKYFNYNHQENMNFFFKGREKMCNYNNIWVKTSENNWEIKNYNKFLEDLITIAYEDLLKVMDPFIPAEIQSNIDKSYNDIIYKKDGKFDFYKSTITCQILKYNEKIDFNRKKEKEFYKTYNKDYS